MKIHFPEWKDILIIKTKKDYFQVKKAYHLAEKIITESFENCEEDNIYYFDIKKISTIFGKRFRICFSESIKDPDTIYFNKILSKLIPLLRQIYSDASHYYLITTSYGLLNDYMSKVSCLLRMFQINDN